MYGELQGTGRKLAVLVKCGFLGSLTWRSDLEDKGSHTSAFLVAPRL